MSVLDCVVIGSGVAGMTAALYLKRANVNVAIIEKAAPGGKLNNIYEIENYPGFINVSGLDLSQNMYKQIKDLGVTYKYGNVLEIIDEKDYKIIKTDVEEIKAKTIIIASGRIPRKLGLPNEEKLIGRGIGFCALCDGFFYKDKTVIVMGGGNSAIEDAIYLAGIAKKVILVHRKDYLTAEAKSQDKLKEMNNVEFYYNSVITEYIEEDNKLSKVKVIQDGVEKLIETSGLFINIGYIPDTDYLTSLGINMDNKYIVVNNQMKTNIDRVYACGDVIKKEIYQITTATGDATIAATFAQKDIC